LWPSASLTLPISTKKFQSKYEAKSASSLKPKQATTTQLPFKGDLDGATGDRKRVGAKGIQGKEEMRRFQDKVFPSIQEISYCIKNKLINKREVIVFKMILDHLEATYSHRVSYNNCSAKEIKTFDDLLIPSQYNFYKQLNQ